MKFKGVTTDKHWLSELTDRIIEDRGEYVKSRFYIIEKTLPVRLYQNDGHGRLEPFWTSVKTDRVSDYFDLKEDAESFLDAHEPDEGKTLEIKEERLYRRVVETWY